MKSRLAWVFLAVATLAGMAAIVRGSAKQAAANWAFGKVQLTNLGERGIGLYTSLYNRGAASRESVQLFALPMEVPAPRPKVDVAVADFTRQARDKVGVIVVEAVFMLPPSLHDAGTYQLVVVVDEVLTDRMTVRDGSPQPEKPRQ